MRPHVRYSTARRQWEALTPTGAVMIRGTWRAALNVANLTARTPR